MPCPTKVSLTNTPEDNNKYPRVQLPHTTSRSDMHVTSYQLVISKTRRGLEPKCFRRRAGQLANIFLVPNNSPRSLYERQLGLVSLRFHKKKTTKNHKKPRMFHVRARLNKKKAEISLRASSKLLQQSKLYERNKPICHNSCEVTNCAVTEIKIVNKGSVQFHSLQLE